MYVCCAVIFSCSLICSRTMHARKLIAPFWAFLSLSLPHSKIKQKWKKRTFRRRQLKMLKQFMVCIRIGGQNTGFLCHLHPQTKDIHTHTQVHVLLLFFFVLLLFSLEICLEVAASKRVEWYLVAFRLPVALYLINVKWLKFIMKTQSGAQYIVILLLYILFSFFSLSLSPFLLRFIALSCFQIEILQFVSSFNCSFIHFVHLLAFFPPSMAVCILLFFNSIPLKLRGGIKRLITHVSYGLKLGGIQCIQEGVRKRESGSIISIALLFRCIYCVCVCIIRG